MSRHVTYEEIATEFVYGNWGLTAVDVKDAIRESNFDMLQLAVLIDIAKSLRPLRCSSAIEIPSLLRSIKKNTTKRRRKKRI